MYSSRCLDSVRRRSATMFSLSVCRFGMETPPSACP
jgi:hypothetical protein